MKSSQFRVAPWVAYAAALWAFVFACFHIVWALGWSLIQIGYFLITGRFRVAAVGIWEPWFYLGAILFGLSTWRVRQLDGWRTA